MPQTGREYAPPLAMALFLPGCRSLNNACSLPVMPYEWMGLGPPGMGHKQLCPIP